MPYVLFRDTATVKTDGTAKNGATVMAYTGVGYTGWSVVGAAGFSSGTASWNSLALDASNKPFVAFADSDNASKVSLMSYNA